jgi:hypothetical protein
MPTITTDQGLTLPATTDADNVPLSMTAYNGPNGVESRLVKRYLSIADRTARNGAPTEGELSYLIDLNRYDTFNGTAWVPLYPVTAFAALTTSFTTTSAAFTTAGVALLGVTIVVPNSGQIRVDWAADLDHSSATGLPIVAPQLNTGAVIGGGAVIAAASDDVAIYNEGTQGISGLSSFFVYTGLTAGADVNVFLTHRTNAATATIARRKVLASQA